MVVTSLIWLARVHLFYFSFPLKIAHLDSLALFHPSICFQSFSYSFISEDRSSMFLLFPFTLFDLAPFTLFDPCPPFSSSCFILYTHAFTSFSCLFTRHSFPYFSPFFFCLRSITFLALPQSSLCLPLPSLNFILFQLPALLLCSPTTLSSFPLPSPPLPPPSFSFPPLSSLFT